MLIISWKVQIVSTDRNVRLPFICREYGLKCVYNLWRDYKESIKKLNFKKHSFFKQTFYVPSLSGYKVIISRSLEI